MAPSSFLYVTQDLAESGSFRDDRLASYSERHACRLTVPRTKRTADPIRELTKSGAEGLVVALDQGWAGRKHLLLAKQVLELGRTMWLYWPAEDTVERVDRERLGSLWRHWVAIKLYQQWRGPLDRGAEEVDAQAPLREASRALTAMIERSSPIPFRGLQETGPRNVRAPLGFYLRTDFWAPIKAGGSYGHTCYVAKELAALTDQFVAFMPSRYALMDQLGLHQVVLPAPSAHSSEWEIVNATAHYYPILRVACEAMRPGFIYERVCLGNYAGARLSQDLGIPYVVEYNGSEIQMRKSFDGQGYEYEALYLKAEEAAFRQASVITVVSDHVKEDVVRRGIEADKILVNPNGADVEEYAPPTQEERRASRFELGWDDTHCVIGFTGTFGGWHGVEVLAEAIPRICAQIPKARFLLIGDGALKHLVDEQVERHSLGDRVHSTGWVPHQDGARLLTACDVLVSPHHRHMNDSPFFGSPTKLFEYMAVGGGIVASDLEQIGEVLSPALKASGLGTTPVTVKQERAVLCTPGDVGEFVTAVCYLAEHPELAGALGRNAREAVVTHYSWKVHVERLWRFLLDRGRGPACPQPTATHSSGSREHRDLLATGDAYKDQTQQQWNNDPCGSQYGHKDDAGTLRWFQDIEAHRYGEYGPWMPRVMEFAEHRGESVLEVGGGLGTDLAQFAMNGALVTDVDLSAGHLSLAQQNFRLRGLKGEFIHQDAERLPFETNRFDVVYSNGVIHHTPNTALMVAEIFRVLKPGGKAIIMVYAENSLHYWGQQVFNLGLRHGLLRDRSIGDIMSGHVEMGQTGAKPLVKVYTKTRLRQLFRAFTDVRVYQRQLTLPELPRVLRWCPVHVLERIVGWNLVIKARKPLNG